MQGKEQLFLSPNSILYACDELVGESVLSVWFYLLNLASDHLLRKHSCSYNKPCAQHLFYIIAPIPLNGKEISLPFHPHRRKTWCRVFTYQITEKYWECHLFYGKKIVSRDLQVSWFITLNQIERGHKEATPSTSFFQSGSISRLEKFRMGTFEADQFECHQQPRAPCNNNIRSN